MRPVLPLLFVALASACGREHAATPVLERAAPSTAPEAAPRSPPAVDVREAAAPAWPGISTDLRGRPAVATARVTAPAAALMRKPADVPDSFWPLRRGHLVEIMAREGPPLGDGAATVPVRFAGLHGWVRADALEDLDRPGPPADALWVALRAAAGATVPAECPKGVLLADLDGAPGEEAVVHGIGPERCQRTLGVFTLTEPPRMLGWLVGDLLERVEVRPLAGGPTFLETATFWQRDVRLTGSTMSLWLLPPQPGPLVEALSRTDRAVDARVEPVRYELARVAWPQDPTNAARWLVHRRLTKRTTIDDTEHDEVSSEVLRWDGRFVPILAPEGLPPLPPEPPSIVRGDENPSGAQPGQ